MPIPRDGNSGQPNDQGFANQVDLFAPSKSVMAHESAAEEMAGILFRACWSLSVGPWNCHQDHIHRRPEVFSLAGARFRSRHIDAGFRLAWAFCH